MSCTTAAAALRRSTVDLQQASTHGRGEGQPHSSKMGASRVTFNMSTTSRGTVVGADLDDGIRESGIPDKVRMPRRYVKAARAAHRRVQTRAVDSEAVRHFIEQTDLDYPRDGQVDAHDIAIFARKMSVRPPPEGWEARCEMMVQECLQRTGYGNKGMPNTAPPVISAADIVAACRTRTDPCSKEVTARPFRDDWIALVKAANDGRVFLPPSCADVCHAPPLLTDRERRVVEKTIPKTATILRGRRTTRDMRGNGGASIKNDAFSALFGGVTDATKPPLKPRPPVSGMRTRADGLLNDSIAETDPNYKAAKLISDMTSAKHVAAPSEGAAPACFAGPAPAPPLASPSITFAARRSYEGLKQQIIKGASEYHASPKKEKQAVDARPASLGPGEPFVENGTWTQPRWNSSRVYHDRMAFPPMFHEKEPEHVAVRIKPGLDDSTVVTQPSFVVPPRAGKTKFEHNLYMSSLEARRTFLGKAVQAFYELDEVPAYKHTYRASDPVGWDRRSRLVQAQREKELKVPFSTLMTRKPKQRTASVLGEPDINYESVMNSGSLQYARLAVHPMLDPDDPAYRAF